MISLIENTGIQFVNFEFSLEGVRHNNFRFAEVQENTIIPGQGQQQSHRFVLPKQHENGSVYNEIEIYNQDSGLIDNNGEIEWDNVNEDALTPIFPPGQGNENIYTINKTAILQVMEGQWIPLPYFKVEVGGGLVRRPAGWARIMIKQKSGDETYQACIAFETSATDGNDPNYFLTNTDATNAGTTFKCLCQNHEIFFLNFLETERQVGHDDNWLKQWLNSLIVDRVQGDPRLTRLMDRQFIDVAFYLGFLNLLSKGVRIGFEQEKGIFPLVNLYSKNQIINTSLVLDIGNSRTSGLIIEDESNFQEIEPIELVNLSNPFDKCKSPFDMEVIFKNENFGAYHTMLDLIDGTKFKWPSMVRLGKEAKILSNSSGQNGQSHLSSPKRYLWDLNPQEEEWTPLNLEEETLNNNPLSPYFTNDGSLKVSLNEGETEINGKPSFNYNGTGDFLKNRLPQRQEIPFTLDVCPKYSRRSLMVFSFIELIIQSIQKMNSFEYRGQKPSPHHFRKLANIIISCPTAMTKREQKELRMAADDAVDALKYCFQNQDLFSSQINVVPSPYQLGQTEWNFDEATCSQLVYLYSELKKFDFNASKYFKIFGSRNDQNENAKLKLASVDIGAGTTDLMICSYVYDPSITASRLIPEPLFWEGFNIAGDHIAKRIAEQIIIPAISRQAQSLGITHPEEICNFLFGECTPNHNALDVKNKKRIGKLLLLPLSYQILEKIENEPEIVSELDFLSLMGSNNNLPRDLHQYINNKIGNGFSLENMNFSLHYNQINSVISKTMEKAIVAVSKLIKKFKVDTLLLSGRPSNQKCIQNLFYKYLPELVHKTTHLGNYQPGQWYPGSTGLGYLKDPKSSVVVGAAIAYFSSKNMIPNFQLNVEKLTNLPSTINYIGEELNANTPIIQDVVLSSAKLNAATISLIGGEKNFGFKQIDVPTWISSSFYSVRLASIFNSVVFNFHEFDLSTVTIDVSFENETILVESITDANGAAIKYPNHIVKHFQCNSTDASLLRKYSLDGPRELGNGILEFEELRIPTIIVEFKTLRDKRGYWKDTGEMDVANQRALPQNEN